MTDKEQHQFYEDLVRRLRVSPLIEYEYGLARHVAEARQATAALVHPEAMQWLPDVKEYFNYLQT